MKHRPQICKSNVCVFDSFEMGVISQHRNSIHRNTEMGVIIVEMQIKTRSRAAFVQYFCLFKHRKYKKGRSVSAVIDGKVSAKPSDLEDFLSGLVPIDPTRFVAKRPRQDPYSHGFRTNTNKAPAEDHRCFWAERPGELLCCLLAFSNMFLLVFVFLSSSSSSFLLSFS